jgi:intraflagellar transport protein 140
MHRCRCRCHLTTTAAPPSASPPFFQSAIRVGDCFALLIDHHYRARNMDEAYRLVEKMQQRSIVLDPYLDSTMLGEIYSAAGVSQQGGGEDQKDGTADLGATGDVGEDSMSEDIEEDEEEDSFGDTHRNNRK